MNELVGNNAKIERNHQKRTRLIHIKKCVFNGNTGFAHTAHIHLNALHTKEYVMLALGERIFLERNSFIDSLSLKGNFGADPLEKTV